MATAHHPTAGETTAHKKHPPYVLVFVALAILTALITAVELLYVNGYIPLPRPVVNSIYLSMSLTKAILVAMFYMHLKQDSFVYTVLFGTPVIFAIIFFILLLI
jgi:cytochrome c oxidase subunit IV